MARDRWDSRIAFVLASIGSAIGLGNIWRFPYVCYKYGGGAFLIAYLVALFSVGIPLLILEFGLGHKTESAAPRAFKKTNKRLEFFGWGAVCVAFVITTYYAVVMAWCFYYGVSATTLAWGDNPSEFFYGTVLKITEGPLDFGSGNTLVLAGLLAAWIFIVLSVWKGAKTVGKIVYLTVLVPWLLLIIFVAQGVTLPGAVDGLNYYLTPDFSKLLDPEIWLQAYTQVFFSVSLGFGIMIAYASFLPRTADISNNALLIGLCDAATAFVGGLAVFGALGFHAHRLGQDSDIWLSEVRGRPDVATAALDPPTEEGGAYQAHLVLEPPPTEDEAAVLEESPHLLLARDLEDGFFDALKRADAPVAAHLASLLAEETRPLVAAHEEGQAPPADLVAAVVSDLNAALMDGTIHDASAYAGVALDEDTKEAVDTQIEAGEPFPAPLGRRVLAASMPDLVSDSLAHLVSSRHEEIVKGFTGTVEVAVVAELPEGVVAADETEIPVNVVTKSGPGLAFVTYPTIINHLPVARPLFGVLFFLMLLTLAVDSAFSLVEAAAASLRDKWGWGHTRSNLTIAAIGFTLGIPYVLGFGLYWLDIVDHFINGFGLTSVCLGECIFLGWALKSRKNEPIDVRVCAKQSLRWGVTAFFATVAALTGIILALGLDLAEQVPVIVIGGDAVALFVILVIFTSDHRYVEDLRDYANDQSDFKIGRWWNFLVRYITPIVLIFLIVQEIKSRVAASYEGYPRLAEFLGGWLVLHVLVFLAFYFMFLRGKKGGDRMNTSAIIMLVVVSLIFGVGITFCLVRAIQRARAETYGEEEQAEG